jgi:hypothetical protein
MKVRVARVRAGLVADFWTQPQLVQNRRRLRPLTGDMGRGTPRRTGTDLARPQPGEFG